MDPATPGQYGGYQAPPTMGGGGSAIAMAKVAGPAIGLMVTAGIGIALQILGICFRLLGIGMMGAMQQENRMPTFMLGTVGIAIGAVAILVGIVVLVGAM